MSKPKRGNCGSCHWFECGPAASMPNGGERQGLCMVNPPTPMAIMQQVPGSALRPGGPQAQPATIGMRAPTGENGRCGQWRPAGLQPTVAYLEHLDAAH